MKKALLYLARFLSILICFFLAIFILEAFNPNFGWQSGLAHLIPTLFMSIITIIAWKNPKLGGWLLIGSGILILLLSLFGQWRSGVYLVGVSFFIGSLNLLGSTKTK